MRLSSTLCVHGVWRYAVPPPGALSAHVTRPTYVQCSISPYVVSLSNHSPASRPRCGLGVESTAGRGFWVRVYGVYIHPPPSHSTTSFPSRFFADDPATCGYHKRSTVSLQCSAPTPLMNPIAPSLPHPIPISLPHSIIFVSPLTPQQIRIDSLFGTCGQQRLC